jgi:hypothetical protein
VSVKKIDWGITYPPPKRTYRVVEGEMQFSIVSIFSKIKHFRLRACSYFLVLINGQTQYKKCSKIFCSLYYNAIK